MDDRSASMNRNSASNTDGTQTGSTSLESSDDSTIDVHNSVRLSDDQVGQARAGTRRLLSSTLLLMVGVVVGAVATFVLSPKGDESVTTVCLAEDPWGRVVENGGGSGAPRADQDCPAGTCIKLTIAALASRVELLSIEGSC